MRGRTLLILAAGPLACWYLVLPRGSEAATWLIVPLLIWLVGAARVTVGARSAALQAAVVALIGVAAGGWLAPAAWSPSFWDSVLAAVAVSAIANAAARRALVDRPRWPRNAARWPRGVAGAVTAVCTVLLTCSGAILLIRGKPVGPPNGLVYPLPATVSNLVQDEAAWCGQISATCTWEVSFDVLDPDVAEVPANLMRAYANRGWHLAIAETECRTWGLIKERACMRLHFTVKPQWFGSLTGSGTFESIPALELLVTYYS